MNKDTDMLEVIHRIGKFKAVCLCAECGQNYETNFYTAKKSRIGHLCKQCKNISNSPLTQETLQKFYNYDPLTGVLTVRLPQQQTYVGDALGTVDTNGYLVMGIASKTYLVHRIIWMYVKGYMPEQIDHINHKRLDNRWLNLREVSNTVNAKNCSTSKNSVTKINGVSYMTSINKYRAYITVNKKHIHLGVFINIEDAKQARKNADLKYQFHVNHGN